MGICLDSTVIIDFLNGRKEAVEVINKYKEKDSFFTTEINVFEVLLGVYLKKVIDETELTKSKDFFNTLDILPFDNWRGEEASVIHSSLSKSAKIIEQADIFISAIMKRNGFSRIISRNKEHFSRIEGIEVIGY